MNFSIYLNGSNSCVNLTYALKEEHYDDFESDFGHWDDNLGIDCPDIDAWGTRSVNTTSLNTGPYTGGVGGAGTYFMYVETSSGNCYDDGDVALVTFNTTLDYDTSTGEEIEFYFNAYGAHIDDLYLEENSTGSWVSIWEMHDLDIDYWNKTTVDLSSLSDSGKLRFNYTRTSTGFESDIALDRIKVSYSPQNPSHTEITNHTWTDISVNLDYLDNFGIWLEADYDCSSSTWDWWFPDIYFRGCCENCVCSEDLS